MSGCGAVCVLFIWSIFLLPIIISSSYLFIKKNQIKSKAKYLIISTIIGYMLIIGFNFLIGFVLRNFIDSSNINMNTLSLITTLLLYIPPILASHLLAKNFNSLPRCTW